MRDAKDVRVDRKRGLLESDRHDDARRFSPDAGERFELLAFRRYLSIVLLDEAARGLNDILRFHSKETARANDLLDVALLGVGQFFRRRIFAKEHRRRHVHPSVGALGRKNHGD